MIRPLLFFFIWLSVSTSPALSRQLVADLSSDEVSITTDFTGQNLLLFGAVSNVDTTAIAGRESDIIVILTGPTLPLSSRKKERVSGIWINTQTVQWRNAPSFYHLFSTRPLTEIAGSEALGDARIGADTLGLRMAQAAGGNNGHGAGDDSVIGAPVAGTAAQTEGLARNMTRMGLWGTKTNAVATQQDMLYRTALSLPSNVPPGAYVIRVLHFRDGVAINESKTDMNVRKAGLSALIYRFAHDYSLFYGLFAIAFAVASGWLAAVAFRRG